MPEKLKYFEDWDLAFDHCRSHNHPVKVQVLNAIYKLYPSGRADYTETTDLPADERSKANDHD